MRLQGAHAARYFHVLQSVLAVTIRHYVVIALTLGALARAPRSRVCGETVDKFGIHHLVGRDNADRHIMTQCSRGYFKACVSVSQHPCYKLEHLGL